MTKTLLLGLLASFFITSPAIGQGLVGVRHAEVDGGYLRLSGSGITLDGWGGGASLNVPLVQDQVGVDFRPEIGYTRLTNSDVTIDGFDIEGVFRVYTRLDETENITPFVDAGLLWEWERFKVPGDRETETDLFLPLGAGVEFVVDPFTIAPFFRYDVGLSSGSDDIWVIGAKAAYWFDPQWGLTLTSAYIDADDVDGFAVFSGLVFSF